MCVSLWLASFMSVPLLRRFQRTEERPGDTAGRIYPSGWPHCLPAVNECLRAANAGDQAEDEDVYGVRGPAYNGK
jgi:hypothetical protein